MFARTGESRPSAENRVRTEVGMGTVFRMYAFFQIYE